MRTVILCEGTTDLLMIQFVLQYKYGWKYDNYSDDSESNRLIKKKLVKLYLIHTSKSELRKNLIKKDQGY